MNIIWRLRRKWLRRRAERLSRRAFAGAVAGQEERFASAIQAIKDADPSVQSRVLHLVYLIATTAMRSIHHDEFPEGPQLRRLSHEFADYEAWSEIDAKSALTCLTALSEGRHPVQVLPVETALPITFAVSAWLLSAFIPDEVEWTDFLDGILDRIERRERDEPDRQRLEDSPAESGSPIAW